MCKSSEEAIKDTICLPPEITTLSHQIAGHYHDQMKKKLGMLSHVDGSVLKPIGDDNRGIRERKFYEHIFLSEDKDDGLLQLKSLIPVFLGLFETNIYGKRVVFMKMEDITKDFKFPSVMDVKIGRKTFDPDSTPDKREREILKYPLMEEIGFRILGMRVYDATNESYMVHGKELGLSLTQSTVTEGLHKYFLNHRTDDIKRIINSFLKELNVIKSWFDTQTQFTFYSSSLLFVHGEKEGTTEYGATVKMIDFAHVFHEDQKDENYVFGLNSLIKIFRELGSKIN